MVSNVGLNLNGLYNTGLNTTLNTGLKTSSSSSSIFGNVLAPTPSYEDDLLMPDFLKTTSPSYQQNIQAQAQQIQAQQQAQQVAQNQTAQPAVPQTSVPATTQNAVTTVPQNVSATVQQPQNQSNMDAVTNQLVGAKMYQTARQNQLNEYIMSKDPSIKVTEKGNVYRESSSAKTVGVTAGVAAPIVMALSKGAKALFSKSTLVKISLLGIAGYAIGSLVDNYINSKRANAADGATYTQAA